MIISLITTQHWFYASKMKVKALLKTNWSELCSRLSVVSLLVPHKAADWVFAIVSRIAHLHQGVVEAINHPNGGLQVCIKIPLMTQINDTPNDDFDTTSTNLA